MNRKKFLRSCFLLTQLANLGIYIFMDELVIDYGLSIPDNCSTLSPLCYAPSYSQSVSSFQHLFNYLAAPASCLFLFHPVLCLLFLSGQLCCTVWPSLWLELWHSAFQLSCVFCLHTTSPRRLSQRESGWKVQSAPSLKWPGSIILRLTVILLTLLIIIPQTCVMLYSLQSTFTCFPFLKKILCKFCEVGQAGLTCNL